MSLYPLPDIFLMSLEWPQMHFVFSKYYKHGLSCTELTFHREKILIWTIEKNFEKSMLLSPLPLYSLPVLACHVTQNVPKQAVLSQNIENKSYFFLNYIICVKVL